MTDISGAGRRERDEMTHPARELIRAAKAEAIRIGRSVAVEHEGRVIAHIGVDYAPTGERDEVGERIFAAVAFAHLTGYGQAVLRSGWNA